MNVNLIEKKLIKAIRKEKEEVSNETSFMTLETVEDRFIHLENVVKKLFITGGKL